MAVNKVKRHIRIRKKLAGTADRPRLAVFRSIKGMYVQAIDDDASVTLLGMSDKVVVPTKDAKAKKEKAPSKKERAYALGKAFGEAALKAKITDVVFDRGGNKYHGRVSEFARGAREAGLHF